MKKKQGISLIVLSITILVMAILAATAIISLEDSGIIGRSKNTVSKQNQQEEYTRLMVIKNGILTDNLGTITVDEYIAELTDKGLIENTIITNDDDSKTITTKTGFEITISQSTTSDLTLEFKRDNDQTSEDNTTPTLISFTVAGYEYQAEEGMTWGEWLDSEYNTGYGSYVIVEKDGFVGYDIGKGLFEEYYYFEYYDESSNDYESVLVTTVIVAGKEYSIG